MARPTQPWYRASKQAWFVTIGGRKMNLGRDQAEALRRFHRLMAGDAIPTVSKPARRPAPVPTPAVTTPNRPTVRALADDYLSDLARRVAPRTHAVAVGYLKEFLIRFSGTEVATLNRREVSRWIGARRVWSPTTKCHVADRITAMMNWAVRDERIAANPLRGMEKPRAVSRGADAVVSAGDTTALMDGAKPFLKDILTALYDTGARPSEVLGVSAAEFYPSQAVWVMRDHKTGRKTGKPRVVHLTPRVVETCRALALRHPSGPLYRTLTGKPFKESNYFATQVRALRRKLGLPESVIPYGLRHGFATDALAKGVPDALVAELLGHTGTAMLHKHYAHLGERRAALKAGLGAVRGNGGAGGS